MMALLRSRKAMFFLVGLVVVGLVVSGALGLFNAIATAPASAPAAPEGQSAPEAPDPADAPGADVLGAAPPGLAYSSDPEDGVHCDALECVRLVAVLTEEGEAPEDSEEAVETVYHHLMDHGWKMMLPEGVESPDDVYVGETFLTDGTTLIADSSDHGGGNSSAVLMLGNARLPSS